MNRTLILLLAALGLTLALLMWNSGSGTTAGLANDDFAQLVMLLTLLASVVAGGMWYRGSFSGALRDIALWLAIFLAAAFAYQSVPALQVMFNG
jgi:aspartyl protease family protein